MAKPDLSDGWLQLAHELFAALMLADLSKAESVVMHEVIDQMYGSHPRQRLATIRPSEACHKLGCLREFIWKGIKRLTASGMVEREGEDGYRLVKNYDLWMKPDGKTPRLTEKERERCRAARRAPGTHDASACVRNHPVPEPDRSVTIGFRSKEPSGSAQRNHPVPLEGVPLTTPYKEKEKKEERTDGAHAGETPSQIIPRQAAEPPLPDLTDADLERRSAALRQIIDAARDAFGERGERWAATYGHEHTERVPAVLEAIRAAKVAERAGVSIRSIGGLILSKLNAAPSRNGHAAPAPKPEKPRMSPEEWNAYQDRLAASVRPPSGYGRPREAKR